MTDTQVEPGMVEGQDKLEPKPEPHHHLRNAPSPTLPAPKAERHTASTAQKAIPAKMHPSESLCPAR